MMSPEMSPLTRMIRRANRIAIPWQRDGSHDRVGKFPERYKPIFQTEYGVVSEDQNAPSVRETPPPVLAARSRHRS